MTTKEKLDALYSQPLYSAEAVRQRKLKELRLKGWTDDEINAIELVGQTAPTGYLPPTDDLDPDTRPHGCDRFGNPCECDDCQAFNRDTDAGTETVARDYNGHREDQVWFSLAALVAALVLGVIVGASWAVWEVVLKGAQ